jgi:hypothetical protein
MAVETNASGTYSVNFNKAAYKDKSKAEFKELEKHHAEHGINLGWAYDKMFPETKKAETEVPAKTEKPK